MRLVVFVLAFNVFSAITCLGADPRSVSTAPHEGRDQENTTASESGPHALRHAEVRLEIDASTVVNTMRGGIGASWHAIEEPISTEFDSRFGIAGHGGSAWGANPPADDRTAWEQLYRHASWLGMDFVRVELEQRMYQPQRGKFDWDNPEMRILYRILDWCQQHHADVFLTQMWSNVAWNAFPEFRDTPAGVVHSGPASMEDFAEGLATCVEHLIKDKGYTCIKWLCITNEPGYTWSWWNRPPNEPMPLKPGLEAVRKALDARKLAVKLAAPDMVGVPELDPDGLGYSSLVGAYDYHSYGVRSAGEIATQHEHLSAWGNRAHQRSLALFLSELGYGVYKGSDPTPASYVAALHNAGLVVRHLNAGVDGFNRWSFINRGDLDGQFQMVETWEREKGQLLDEFQPKANPYFTYGLLSRFTAKHSDVLASRVEGGEVDEESRVFAAALRSPRGSLTLAVVNDAPREWTATIHVNGLKKAVPMHAYVVSEKGRDVASMQIQPAREFVLSDRESTITDNLPAASLTVYTTYRLNHTDPGIICD